METRFYQTQNLDLQRIAQTLVFQFQGQGYQAQQFGDAHQVIVQLHKESTLRTITGLNKALTISMQFSNDGTVVTVGAHDWVDQIAVGAVGLVIHPLLITAAVGAYQQNTALHDVLNAIDYQIRQQHPQAQYEAPPTNL